MEKDRLPPDQTDGPPPRPSLAEEQRLAFEAERRRVRKPILSLNWTGQIFRN